MAIPKILMILLMMMMELAMPRIYENRMSLTNILKTARKTH
jgi:hypothetical protein